MKENDTISRQAAIDELCDNCDNVKSVCPHYPCKQYTAIEQLPSAQPEPRKGKWVIDNGLYRCSACNHLWSELWWVETVPLEKMFELMPYCPNCGARMEESE